MHAQELNYFFIILPVRICPEMFKSLKKANSVLCKCPDKTVAPEHRTRSTLETLKTVPSSGVQEEFAAPLPIRAPGAEPGLCFLQVRSPYQKSLVSLGGVFGFKTDCQIASSSPVSLQCTCTEMHKAETNKQTKKCSS